MVILVEVVDIDKISQIIQPTKVFQKPTILQFINKWWEFLTILFKLPYFSANINNIIHRLYKVTDVVT